MDAYSLKSLLTTALHEAHTADTLKVMNKLVKKDEAKFMVTNHLCDSFLRGAVEFSSRVPAADEREQALFLQSTARIRVASKNSIP
jgi:hypothetical protein